MTSPHDNGALVPGGGRDLDRLKEEVQRRATYALPPLTGISAEDAQTALAQVTSLDRDQWAASGSFGRYAERRAVVRSFPG